VSSRQAPPLTCSESSDYGRPFSATSIRTSSGFSLCEHATSYNDLMGELRILNMCLSWQQHHCPFLRNRLYRCLKFKMHLLDERAHAPVQVRRQDIAAKILFQPRLVKRLCPGTQHAASRDVWVGGLNRAKTAFFVDSRNRNEDAIRLKNTHRSHLSSEYRACLTFGHRA
jgi:hypothetical protein